MLPLDPLAAADAAVPALPVLDEAPPVLITEDWCPDAWCVSLRQLPPPRDGSGRGSHWVFMLWSPSAQALPARRPDAWGLSAEDPCARIAGMLEGSPVRELDAGETLWSVWLRIVLRCQPLDAGLRESLLAACAEAEAQEAAEWVGRYGDAPAGAH